MRVSKITSTLFAILFATTSAFACSGAFSIAWSNCESLDPTPAASGSWILTGTSHGVPSAQENCQNNALSQYESCVNALQQQ